MKCLLNMAKSDTVGSIEAQFTTEDGKKISIPIVPNWKLDKIDPGKEACFIMADDNIYEGFYLGNGINEGYFSIQKKGLSFGLELPKDSLIGYYYKNSFEVLLGKENDDE